MKVFKRMWLVVESRINEIFEVYPCKDDYFISRIEVCSEDECFFVHLQPNDLTDANDVIRIEWDEIYYPLDYYEQSFKQTSRRNKLNKIMAKNNVQ
jgi:hypothetical protein